MFFSCVHETRDMGLKYWSEWSHWEYQKLRIPTLLPRNYPSYLESSSSSALSALSPMSSWISGIFHTLFLLCSIVSVTYFTFVDHEFWTKSYIEHWRIEQWLKHAQLYLKLQTDIWQESSNSEFKISDDTFPEVSHSLEYGFNNTVQYLP